MNEIKGITSPVISYSRLRMATDGKGVTTLVCFHGCPLRCNYCINPFSFDPLTQRKEMTALSLYEQIKKDELYFLATGGGATFGGGEPLLYSHFLKEFRLHCGKMWHLSVETSLNVNKENVRIAAECIDMFYVDCKDTNSIIYKKYTGVDNKNMLDNLQLLLSLVGSDRIAVRVPLIPQYNTDQDRQKSVDLLSSFGITQFDLFTYKINNGYATLNG